MISWETLASYEVRLPRFERVSNLPAAAAFARSLDGRRVCLKAETDLHKSKAGLVIVDLDPERTLAEAWRRLERNAEEAGIEPPFLIQEMVPAGPELFVGVKRDPTFGPLLVAGIGGRLVESIRRHALRLLPITAAQAREIVDELGLEQLEPESAAAFAAALVAVSRLVADHNEIEELDLNPIILSGASAVAVDLRVVAGGQGSNRHIVSANGSLDRAAHARNRSDSSAEAIRRLFEPKSVAVIGASVDRSKPGGRVCAYLAAHRPDLPRYLVNRNGGVLDGEQVLERIEDLPEGIDAAVIATPAASVPAVLRELGQRRIHVAVVFAAGFKEAGASELERQVADAAREAGVRVCGVNCMGVIGEAPLTFTQALMSPAIDGGVSFVTQSGAIGGSLLIGAWADQLGTARFVSVGNETDLALPDYLDFLADDDRTTTVGVFLEGVADGRRLRGALARVHDAGKGLVVLRTGASDVAAEAVRTHTGALAGSDTAYRQVIGETGAVMVDDLPGLLGTCQVLEWQPRAQGRRVGVISTSGGACSLVADELVGHGLEVPELEPEVRARLGEVLPPFAATRNPVDTTGNIAGDPTLLRRILEPVLQSRRVDAAVVAVSALVGQAANEIAETVIDLARTATKPIVVGWMLPEAAVAEPFRRLRENRIPAFDSITLACAALRGATPAMMQADPQLPHG
jgi:acyl-CoA synthetase (NDP forming)